MTPDVVVDIGNSRMKWGRVRDRAVVEMVSLNHDDPVGWKRQLELWGDCNRWAAAAVAPEHLTRLQSWLDASHAEFTLIDNSVVLDVGERIGFETDVDAARIGTDRLLAAFAAAHRKPREAGAVVIGIGTAMTVDFVRPDNTHAGGAILPGPWMMATALHEHTAKLPRIDPRPLPPDEFCGTDTAAAIRSGIAAAVQGAATELILNWWNATGVASAVLVTGGGAGFYDNPMLDAETVSVFAVVPELTLDGLRIAAEALP